MIEEARTNEWLNSEDASSASKSNIVSIVTDNVVAPDGTTTADTVTFGVTRNTWTIIYQGLYNGTYVWSGYLKTNDGSTKDLFLSWGAPSASRVATFTVTGEWQRFSAVVTPANMNVHLGNHNTLSPESWNGAVIDVWGLQLEEASTLSSYIPTAGSTVTRAADVAQIDGFTSLLAQNSDQLITQSGDSLTGIGLEFGDFYSQSQGTLFADATGNGVRIAGFNDGTESNRHELLFASTNVTAFQKNAGVNQVDISSAVFPKSAFAYATNDYALSVGGAAVVQDTSATPPTVHQMSIGNWYNSAEQIHGHIKRLAYFPTRLVDATLRSITS